MSDWRDISTAPEDDVTGFLLSDGKLVTCGYQTIDQAYPTGWFTFEQFPEPSYPTHWMPLPDPPTP